jgi:hypothetical protein
MKALSRVKDGLLILVLLFVAWKGNEMFTVEPVTNTVEKVVFKKVDVPVTQTVIRNIYREKDTVIYITSVERDTIVIRDTLIIKPNAKFFSDTIKLDSFGYIEAKHVYVRDDLRSFYKPFLKMRERTITTTNTIVKNNNYIGGSVRYDGSVQIGLDVMNKNVIYGLDYDPLRKNIGARVGYVFIKY